MSAINIAQANISLKDLVSKNSAEGISGIVNSTVTFQSEKGDFIGVLQYKMRMRTPISNVIRWLKEKKELGLLDDDMVQEQIEMAGPNRKRKLIVLINKANGLKPKSKNFVFFSMNGKV